MRLFSVSGFLCLLLSCGLLLGSFFCTLSRSLFCLLGSLLGSGLLGRLLLFLSLNRLSNSIGLDQLDCLVDYDTLAEKGKLM